MALIEEMGGFGNLMNDQDLLTKVLNQFTKRDMNPGDRTTTPLADILSNPKEYVFYIDVPGLAKSDVQVQLEDENILVVKANGKRKREDGEEEGCKYLKLERSLPQKMMRKFRLPQDADASTISAKCENGVLTVTVKKIPPSKPKTVQVAIS
ncbi:17.4 kDa class III heat shock protein-like [Chenopodium quinoa]|uniref:17.4 kDa class III heat shock protein-like n=1 Tax=Chenopodium quinoa TaxID=63459 RepID=UPI000B786796|nr:17.4 kDa class III heat shock protein-like [Chenopodium quinoa]XP_021716579.1 17.4 kDa class III heat shock protein-like [Chenopodium quinoa]XP_021716580.1 17.4 kDa class III heat shock protein-like [Chenopodium quinoa]